MIVGCKNSTNSIRVVRNPFNDDYTKQETLVSSLCLSPVFNQAGATNTSLYVSCRGGGSSISKVHFHANPPVSSLYRELSNECGFTLETIAPGPFKYDAFSVCSTGNTYFSTSQSFVVNTNHQDRTIALNPLHGYFIGIEGGVGSVFTIPNSYATTDGLISVGPTAVFSLCAGRNNLVNIFYGGENRVYVNCGNSIIYTYYTPTEGFGSPVSVFSGTACTRFEQMGYVWRH